jgi:RimJ/RimL family protein N-acetyltransferase
MLTGKLVRLRPMEPSDTESLWRWNNDPVVMRWLYDSYPQSLAQAKKRAEERPSNSYERVLFGIEVLSDKRLIGVVALSGAYPETGRAELDIYIGEQDYWGGGYGTDTMKVICRYGFEMMRLHGISLWVVPENTAARHVYEKVGFVEEGRKRESCRRDGKWHDTILMSLLEGELID